MSPVARLSLLVATGLGLAHAGFSLLWVLGSTWLLDTVGGQIEERGREGGAGVRLALLLVVVVKVAAVAIVWVAVRRSGRVMRALAWSAAVVLTVYGSALTLGGAYVLSPAYELSPDADAFAIRWHAFFWDPWFLLWGVAASTALWASRLSVRHRDR